MDAIATSHLTKIYRGHIGHGRLKSLDNLNLTIAPNEVFGFLGRNGAGKTTTIKILCSLLRPTDGDAFVMGKDVRRRETRCHIGYLPENPYFYEYLNPRETLDFYGELNGLSRPQREAEWERLAELLDLRELAEQRVRGFSKGMRQRLGFAVALVGDPDVLILDEPMSGLDPLGRRMIRELILLLHSQGKTIFFSSHVLGDVEQICNRVGILVKGKLTTQGRLDELLARRVNRVEIIAESLPEATVSALAPRSDGTRESEQGRHFFANDMETANALAAEILQAGGKLVEFTPIRESLEEYFMREQENGL
ncbi:MAG: ABC transporter ATP-binding protein [Candidatus Hydrogenedentes bacterium]|nr:ABC transporter ATP-binding protein [Candidatus Hydrogenedentota bacterium]